MPPKRSPNTPAHSSSSSSRALAPATTATEKLRAAYDVLTAKENQSVVRSVALFGVSRGVYFSESWVEGAMGGSGGGGGGSVVVVVVVVVGEWGGTGGVC